LVSGAEDAEIIREKILIKHEELLASSGYKQERNITQEVEDLLYFRGSAGAKLSDIYNDLRLTTKEEKGAARGALLRLASRSVAEKVDSGNTGFYRIINKDLDEVQFIEQEDASTQAFPLWLPLGLNDLCEVYAKNLIIVAGSKGAGKTALLLNIAIANQHQLPRGVLQFQKWVTIEYTHRMRAFGFTR